MKYVFSSHPFPYCSLFFVFISCSSLFIFNFLFRLFFSIVSTPAVNPQMDSHGLCLTQIDSSMANDFSSYIDPLCVHLTWNHSFPDIIYLSRDMKVYCRPNTRILLFPAHCWHCSMYSTISMCITCSECLQVRQGGHIAEDTLLQLRDVVAMERAGRQKQFSRGYKHWNWRPAEHTEPLVVLKGIQITCLSSFMQYWKIW